jgi:hypothetical protein
MLANAAWTTLSDREQRTLAGALEKIRRGAPLSAGETRAVEKRNAARDEEAFLRLVRALPQKVFRDLLGGLSAADVRALGKRCDVALGGKTVDLSGVLPKLVPAAMEAADTGDVARTYGELASKLGLSCADPERTLKAYLSRGMPGRPGKPGRGDGWFPVDSCRLWIEVHTRTNSLPGGSDELHELRERITRLDLEIREREQLEQLERLADVNEVSSFVESVVYNLKAMLEAMPDLCLAALPSEVDEEGRRSIHQVWTQQIDQCFEEMARLSRGDDDLTEPDDHGEETEAGDEPPEGGGP